MPVTTEIHHDIALIRMDDGKANAINLEMIAALNAGLDEAEAGAKAIVLTGRAGRFSGGFDLKALASYSPENVVRLLDQGAELLLRLYGGLLPTVAACNGHAIAMGTFILLACDTRIGTHGAFKLGANETINGMNLPVFALELAHARLDIRHKTRAMVQSFIYDPEGAVDAGILDSLTSAEALESESLAVASQLSGLPGKAYAWNKNAVRKATIDRIRASIGAHHRL
jgi:enoyl-CoA hydratase